MTDAAPALCEGYMMKKKRASGSSRALLRSLTLKWVTRYFVLYENGKLVYFKDKDASAKDPGDVLCDNAGACAIERVTAADLAGREDAVANSFYVCAPGRGRGRGRGAEAKTLLVTHGPADFKRWILAFRKCEGAAVNVPEVAAPPPALAPVAEIAVQAKEEGEEEVPSDIPKEVGGTWGMKPTDSPSDEEVERAPEKDGGEAPFDESPSKPAPPLVAEEASPEPVEAEVEDTPESSEALPVEADAPDAPQAAEAAPEPPTESDADIEAAVQLLEEERRKELKALMKDRSRGKDGRKAAMDAAKERYDGLIEEAKNGKFATPMEAKAAATGGAEEEAEAPVAEEGAPEAPVAEVSHEATKAAVEAIEAPKEEVIVEKVIPGKNDEQRAAAESAIAALNEAPQKEVVEEEAPEAEAPQREGDMSVQVFAYGDTFDEMHTKLSGDDHENRRLVAILITSLEEMQRGHTEGDKNGAFLIDLAGNNKVHHLLEIERMFCESDASLFRKTHSIFYDEEEGTKEQIVTILEASRGEDKKAPKRPPAEIPAMYSPEGPGAQTAFKKAEPTPTGEEVLTVVREALGTPYNWVVFKPSKKELLIEDAGSGGVMEMANLLGGSYNDRVLFGLARISFVGDTFGRRTFMAGLEWKGDECRSVKMKMQLNQCLPPMAKLIGERSFTLSNLSASEMTPEMIVDKAKRSCNVKDFSVTVEALKKGHEAEQEAIKAYWDKVQSHRTAEEERAKREAEEEEEMRKKFDGDAKGLRRWKWSRMSAEKLLADLGGHNLPGWVLLEVEVPLVSA
ncbi:hypothetical protein ACHAXT_003888 [Thalassiosira profunda]